MKDDQIREKSTDWIDYRKRGGLLSLDEYIAANKKDQTK